MSRGGGYIFFAGLSIGLGGGLLIAITFWVFGTGWTKEGREPSSLWGRSETKRSDENGGLGRLVEPSGVLTRELSERGDDFAAASELTMAPKGRPRPREAVVEGGSKMVNKQFKRMGLKRPMKKWRLDMAEAFMIPYVCVISETWRELDRAVACEMVERGLAGIQAYRKSLGSDREPSISVTRTSEPTTRPGAWAAD